MITIDKYTPSRKEPTVLHFLSSVIFEEMIRGYRSRLLWLICLSILPFIVKTNAVLRTRVIILRGKIREILSQLKFMNNWCRVVYASWHSLKNPQWANGDSQTINSAHVTKFVNILSRMDETRFEKGSENYTYLKTGTRPWLQKKNGDFPKLKIRLWD